MGMLVLMSQLVHAQQHGTITGKVTDARDGSALPGVTVQVKGTTLGTATQPDGTFKIDLPNGATTLIFSFVGFGTQEVNVGDRRNINVSMSTSDKDLSEVVVVGYGTQVKRDLTGSVAKVGAREIENFPAPSFESALQGRAAGVVIESGSGKVGQGMKVRVRGTSSISAGSQPLYVIDGMPVISESQSDINNDNTNPLADLNPNDIASVEVLKDASAAAIYGARASNGVVLITTKKGRPGEKTRIELNASTSFSRPTKKRGFLDAKEYTDLVLETARMDGITGARYGDFATEEEGIDYFTNLYTEAILDRFSLGTDWQKQEVNTDWEEEVYRDVAHARQLDLSATGGNEKTRFYASGFYNDQEAVVIVNRFRRYGGRLNLEHSATSRLSLGINLAINRSQLDRVTNDNIFSTPGQLVAQLPISPIYDPTTGELNSRTLYSNGLIDAAYSFNKQVAFRTIGNAFLNYNFTPYLSFRSEVGTDIYNITEQGYNGKQTQDGGGIGRAEYFFTQNASLNTNNYFTFTPRLGEKHSLTSTLGMSYLQNDFSGSTVQGEGFPSDAIKNLAAAGTITSGSSSNQRYTFLSYFLRANYAFRNRYLVSASIRTDGSSRFGPNTRYGWFPAGSLGWIISEEDFLKSSRVLSFLKLRASYGLTGNAEIGNSSYLTLLEVTNYPELPGFRPSLLGNEDLHWEKTAQVDVGLEFGFLNNRISGEIDYYNKQTSDLLLQANIPYSTGFASIYRNTGKLENKGVEITINTRNIDTRDFTWTTSLNLAYNKNKVKDIQGQIIESGQQRAVEGQPIGVFFLPKFAGVDPETGDALYLDAEGKTTTDYSQAERMVVGKANPDWTGGFNNTLTYKGFDLNVFFTFVEGNNIYNRAGVYQAAGFGGGFDNQTKELLDRWQQPGDITSVPRLSYWYGNGHRASSRWIYDGSYIRLKTLTLGYTLPQKAASLLHISGARLYVAGYNLWTRTDYISDPEVNTGVTGARPSSAPENITSGVDFYTIPQARTFTIGLNVKF